MKKWMIFIAEFLILQSSFSYTWQSYGPEGIKATNLYFYNGFGEEEMPLIIMSDSGFYLRDENSSETWMHFDYPMIDAVLLNSSTLLFIAGDGSFSDGIYSLYIPSGQIDVVHYCANPLFIRYYEDTEVFFTGYDSGLLKSENGLTWESVAFFDGMYCSDLQSCYGRIIVTTQANLSHLFLSDDDGQTWTESTGQPGWITSMAFRVDCSVYGVFPDGSYSSGLWSSEDYGETWVNEFYSTDLNTVAVADGESFVMVGWKNGTAPYEGMALCYTDNPVTEFIFLNETLPDKNINRIFYRLRVCCGAILYASTDSGVFSCGDYFVGIPEETYNLAFINVVPNPFKGETTIKISTPGRLDILSINIMNSIGKVVENIMNDEVFTGEIIWNKGNLPAGIYYLVVRTKNETLTEKFIIL
jgi:hypothetical protein